MLRFLFILSIILQLPQFAQGQLTVSQICREEDYRSEPDFLEITSWLENEVPPTLPPDEAVHQLLSPKSMGLSWARYPCLDLALHFNLSIALRQVGAHVEAENAALIALKLDSVLEGRIRAEILAQLASIAYEKQDYRKAVHYYNLSYEDVQDSKNMFSALGALNNIGLAYFQMDSLDKAEMAFREAYTTYKSAHDSPSTLQASLLDNLAEVALLKKDTSGAIALLHQKDSVLQRIPHDAFRVFDTWATLAELYLLLKDPGQSITYLQKSESLISNDTMYSPDDAYRVALIRFNYSIFQNDLSHAIRSMKQLLSLGERAREELVTRHQTEVRVLHQLSDHNVAQERSLTMAAIERQRQQQQYQSRITLLIVLLCIIILLSLYVYFSSRNKLNKHRIDALEVSVRLHDEKLKSEKLEKELLQHNLEVSEKDLISIALDNARRKEWTKEIMEKLDTVIDKPPDKQQENFRRLYHDLLHQLQIQDRLSLAHEQQDIIQSAFVHQLTSIHPDLTPAEIDLCILIRLGLTGKEIAVVRNIDPESIRKAKYRLRQKLDLATPQELKNFLGSISKS